MTWKELSTRAANIIELSAKVLYKVALLYALYFIGTQLYYIKEMIGYAITK